MKMQFSEAPPYFDLDLRQDFPLFTEKMNLVFEKGFLHQIEIRTGHSLGQIYAKNFGSHSGAKRTQVYRF